MLLLVLCSISYAFSLIYINIFTRLSGREYLNRCKFRYFSLFPQIKSLFFSKITIIFRIHHLKRQVFCTFAVNYGENEKVFEDSAATNFRRCHPLLDVPWF